MPGITKMAGMLVFTEGRHYRSLKNLVDATHKAGRIKNVQPSEYNRATVNNLPIPLVPGCEESANEPKATSTVAALNSTARAMLDCSGLVRPARQ